MRRPSPYEDTGLFVSALSASQNQSLGSTTVHALHHTPFSKNVLAIFSAKSDGESSVYLLPLTLGAEDFDGTRDLRHTLARDASYLASVETPDALLVLTRRSDATLELHHIHPTRLYEERSYTPGLRLPKNSHCHLIYDAVSKNIFILVTSDPPSQSFEIIKADTRFQGVYTASITPSPGFDPVPYNPKHVLFDGMGSFPYLRFQLVDANVVGNNLLCLLRLSLRDQANTYRTMVLKIDKTTLETDKAFGVKGNWVSQHPYPHLEPLLLTGLTSLWGVSGNRLVRLTLHDDGDGLLKEQTLSVALGFSPSANAKMVYDLEGNCYVVSVHRRVLSMAKVLPNGTLEPMTGRHDIRLGAHACTLADVSYHPASKSLLVALNQHAPMLGPAEHSQPGQQTNLTLPRFIKVSTDNLQIDEAYTGTPLRLLPLSEAMICHTRKGFYFANRVQDGELSTIVIQGVDKRGAVVKAATVNLPTLTTQLTALHVTNKFEVFLAGSTSEGDRNKHWLVKLQPDMLLNKTFGHGGIVTLEHTAKKIFMLPNQQTAVLSAGNLILIGPEVQDVVHEPLSKDEVVVLEQDSLLLARVRPNADKQGCLVGLQRVKDGNLDKGFGMEQDDLPGRMLELRCPFYEVVSDFDTDPPFETSKNIFYLIRSVKAVGVCRMKNNFYLVCNVVLAFRERVSPFVVVMRFDERGVPTEPPTWLGWDRNNDIARHFECTALGEVTGRGLTLVGTACPILHTDDDRHMGYFQALRDKPQPCAWQLSLDGMAAKQPVFIPVSRDARLEVRDVYGRGDNLHLVTSLGLVAVSKDKLEESLEER